MQLLDKEVSTPRPNTRGNFCRARVRSRVSSGQPQASWRKYSPKRCTSVRSVPISTEERQYVGKNKSAEGEGSKQPHDATQISERCCPGIHPFTVNPHLKSVRQVQGPSAAGEGCVNQAQSLAYPRCFDLSSIVKKRRGRIPFFAKRRCASAQPAPNSWRYIFIFSVPS